MALVNLELALVDITRQLRQLSRTTDQQVRGIGLRNEDNPQNPHDTGENHRKGIDPAPSSILAKEATADWTEGRTQERCRAIHSDSEAAFARREDIGNHTGCIHNGRGAEHAREEAQYQKRLDILGGNRGTSKERTQAQGDEVDGLPTPNLRHRRPGHRANCEPENEESNCQCRNLCRDIQAFLNLYYRTGDSS